MLGKEVTEEQQKRVDHWVDRVYSGQKPSELEREELKAFFDERDEEGYQDFYNHEWAGFFNCTPIALLGTRLDECLMSALDQGGFFSDDPEDHDMDEALGAFSHCMANADSSYGYFVREIRDSTGRPAQIIFETQYLGQAGHTDEAFMITASIQATTEFLSQQGVLFASALMKDCQIADLHTDDQIRVLVEAAIEKGYEHYSNSGMVGLAQ